MTDRPRADVEEIVKVLHDMARFAGPSDRDEIRKAATLLEQEHARAEKAEGALTMRANDILMLEERHAKELAEVTEQRDRWYKQALQRAGIEDKLHDAEARAGQLERQLAEADALIVAAELAEMCSCWEHDAAVKAAYERHASRASPKQKDVG